MSDLHCHPSSDEKWGSFLHSDALGYPSAINPYNALLELIISETLNADLLIVPGDLTNKVNQQGMVSAWQMINSISSKLGCSDLICTIGNHDVDSRGVHNNGPFGLCKNLSTEFPSKYSDINSGFWSNGFCTIEINDIFTLININSVYHHDNEMEIDHGKVDHRQLELMDEAFANLNPDTFKVAMMHHHPLLHDLSHLGSFDIMENGDSLLEILHKYNFHLVIHGHKHFPRLRYSSGSSSSLPVFAAGSFSSADQKMLAITRNLFHIIEVENIKVEKCNNPGIIKSWEFRFGKGWRKSQSKSTEFPHETGFGCRIDTQEIADNIESYMRKNGDHLDWENIVDYLPYLPYLIPDDLVQTVSKLDISHNIKVYPNPPDNPEIIIIQK